MHWVVGHPLPPLYVIVSVGHVMSCDCHMTERKVDLMVVELLQMHMISALLWGLRC